MLLIAQDSKINQSFASHDHTNSIRCLDISGNFLASGAADDRIFVYDLKTRQEHCMLAHHSSTINCLRFTINNSHLICGTADGTITITRVGNWQVEKIWNKAHKGFPILDIAVHSTGKLALSLGADCTLRTWNLVKGRQAYAINLSSKSKDAKSLDRITWAPCGVKFILSGGIYSEVWSIETGGLVLSIQHGSKVVSCAWISEEKFLVGYENGKIGIVNSDDGKVTVVDGHSSRVKAINVFQNWVISASSGGEIKVWDLILNELTKFDTGCRLTCMCIIPPIAIKKEENNEEAVQVSDEPQHLNLQKKKRMVQVIEEYDDEDAAPSLSSNVKKDTNAKKKKLLKQNSEKISDVTQQKQQSIQNQVSKKKKKKKKNLQ